MESLKGSGGSASSRPAPCLLPEPSTGRHKTDNASNHSAVSCTSSLFRRAAASVRGQRVDVTGGSRPAAPPQPGGPGPRSRVCRPAGGSRRRGGRLFSCSPTGQVVEVRGSQDSPRLTRAVRPVGAKAAECGRILGPGPTPTLQEAGGPASAQCHAPLLRPGWQAVVGWQVTVSYQPCACIPKSPEITKRNEN